MYARDMRLLLLPAANLAIIAFCRFCPAGTEWETNMEAVYFPGALILLAALIYGTLQYHYRNRAAIEVGDEIARERYRRNEG
jgi:hypothetical protein